MKVQELLVCLKNKDFNLGTGLQVKKYLPLEVKKTIAQGILYDSVDDSTGYPVINSIERYMSYVRNMISYHTNLEYTDKDYDVLCSTEYNGDNLLNKILELFASDATECSRILDLLTNDYMQKFTIEYSISNLCNNLGNYANELLGTLQFKLTQLKLDDVLPEDFDFNKMEQILKNIK